VNPLGRVSDALHAVDSFFVLAASLPLPGKKFRRGAAAQSAQAQKDAPAVDESLTGDNTSTRHQMSLINAQISWED